MARPLVTVYNPDGEAADSVPMASVMTAPIRRDVVRFAHTQMAKNRRQAYAVSKYAGMQHSAHSWGTGRAVARIPRVSGSGTHRAGQAAFGNMCRKGRMFAPTKTWRRWHRKLSKGQRRYATASALAASAVPALVMARGHAIGDVVEIPLVVNVEAGSVKKTKEAIALLQAVGAQRDVEKAKDSKTIRAGRGKSRGRKYVLRRGPLVVHNGDADLARAVRNLPGVESANVNALNLLQLAPGSHLGRFIVWTKDAFEALDDVFGSQDEESKVKSGFTLPRAAMTNADLGRIMGDQAVLSALRAAKSGSPQLPRKRNPLRNKGAMAKLNPYSLVVRRQEILNEGQRKARRTSTVAKKRSKAFYNALTTDDWFFNNHRAEK
jgi:large subunit ribosomal protein L4e